MNLKTGLFNLSRRTNWLTVLALISMGLLTMAPAPPPPYGGPSAVVVIHVTSTADSLADDGLCTLREAIIAANTNTASGLSPGECPAGQEAVKDIITLADGATYSLTIDSTPDEDAAQDGDLDIWDNSAATDLIIAVENNGTATISQDAAVDERVLHILGATVKVEGLTLMGGATPHDGGGIAVHGGALTMEEDRKSVV